MDNGLDNDSKKMMVLNKVEVDAANIDAPTQLVKNTLFETIPVLYKQWSCSFEIMPLGVVSGWTSILHATQGGNCGVVRV